MKVEEVDPSRPNAYDDFYGGFKYPPRGRNYSLTRTLSPMFWLSMLP